jgi:hypothetical protein
MSGQKQTPRFEPGPPLKGLETLTAPRFFNDIGPPGLLKRSPQNPDVGGDAVAGLGLAERR